MHKEPPAMTHLSDKTQAIENALPHIDCVLIGINSEKTVGRCIESIQAADYPTKRLHIYYVDGGSSDASITIAKQYEGVITIALRPVHPTPGLGRNAGWKTGSSPLIQFLDSDTILDPGWFSSAIKAIRPEKIGAVQGLLSELYPERSFYNWIGNLEWNGLKGECESFGGNVIVKREALEMTGGYDEEMVGGEDPELSRRIIRAGWKVIQAGVPMAQHDLAMTRFKQYLRRSFRTGYAFAAVRKLERSAGSRFWQYEYRKIIIKGGGFSFSLLLAIPLMAVGAPAASITALALAALGTALLLNPRIFKVGQFMREQQLARKEARSYAWHCSLVVLPQLAGLLRYHIGSIFNQPLRNRPARIASEISVQTP
ncbi:glycosyltransferase [Chlorobium phaeovibrioides]|uniref:Glycosyltransferase n=2 Tax=Chlorobium phaeovibrioides TaxID=1094 RepID=A0A432ATX2_CHLPH|nr:glycosyltransferase [Chlorobium phaeovibrioides]KAA6231772.1 glycosyltransferase [Chlorobium phaeovibrioides]MWV54126.1 glycosyltransferase [Chlorobium phaeovibrioides]QEQ57666.1 glycosyltransferase [Chlorobium phaeovibrioides]RTY34668.1 glycosyltransferase [Chlorobium phaeovibrioides]RTY37770.1 glycosyltransferase [Chlorobium phaeovibrioides]